MENSTLILIDFINEMVDENGKLAGKGYPVFMKEHNVFANINNAITKARIKKIPIIFVRIGFSSDYREWPQTSPLFGAAKKFEALKLDTWATEIHPSINKIDEDFLITKHRVSVFYSTTLEAILNTLRIKTILLGGTSTDIAIQSAAREAHDRDYKVIVLEDLCGAGNDEDHSDALRLISKIALISNSNEVPELN